MWWNLQKSKEDDMAIEYSYGCMNEEMNGLIRYDKETEQSNCVKLAHSDSDEGVSVLLTHIWGIVNTENAPETRKIAIG